MIELLVVVAIIAMLVSLLLPALGRARECARQVTCMNNMREIGNAVMIYGQDHSDRLPGVCGLWETVAAYVGLPLKLPGPQDWDKIGPGKILSVLYCPCDPDPFPWPWMPFARLEITSYMANGADTALGMGGGMPLGVGLFGGQGRLTDPASPSECMLVGESCNYDRVLDCDHPAVRITADYIRQRIHHRYTAGFYHDGRMNVLFADGHNAPVKGKSAEPVTPPTEFLTYGAKFFDNLALLSATENPAFWGPPYDRWTP